MLATSILSIIIIAIISSLQSDNIYIKLSHSNVLQSNVRFKYLVIIILFLTLGILITDSYDIGFYKIAYEQRIPHAKEPLFDFIQFFFHDIGCSFALFKSFWLFLISLLLYKGVKVFGQKPEQAIALSFFIVLLNFITQMRSSLAFAVLLNCIPLLYSNKPLSKVLYAFFVVLCAQMHAVAYMFLLFLIVKKDGHRQYRKVFFVVLGCLSLLIIGFNTSFVKIVSVLLSYAPISLSLSSRIVASISGIGTPIKASLFLICKQLFLYFLTDKACAIQAKNDAKSSGKYEAIGEINTLSLAFIPICLVNASFLRIFNPIALIQYAMILNVGYEKFSISKRMAFKVTMKTVLLCFSLFVLFVSVHSNPEDYIRSIGSIGL